MNNLKRRLIAVLATMILTTAGALLALVVTAPGASAYPGGTGGVSVCTGAPTDGGALCLNGSACAPNSTVTFTLDTGDVLGTATTDANGNYSVTVTLPSGVTGAHTVSVSGAQCAATANVTIVASTGGGGSGGLAGTGVAVLGIGALGVVLLIGGALMLLAGRRRKVIS